MEYTNNRLDDVMDTEDERLSSTIDEQSKTRLQKKIDIVQQILTMLEKAMSSAKSSHQQSQCRYTSRIDELQLQIEKLKWEMNENENMFKTATEPLESDLKKYMALDNILITIEESSKDDGNLLLPDISKSDMFVHKYLWTDLQEWQSLKLQCQKLNYETQTAFSPNICTKLLRVTISKDLTAEEQFRRAVEMANALNMHRGKKYISVNQSPPLVRDIILTWHKNEPAAACYVQNYYGHVIQDVIGKEYVGRIIDITELPADSSNFNFHTMCQTIHVQAKATSANSTNTMPQTITLYQFEDTSYKLPEVTTFNVETASPIRELSLAEEYTHTRPGPSNQYNYVRPAIMPSMQRSMSVSEREEIVSDTSDTISIQSILGIDDVPKTLTQVSRPKTPSVLTTTSTENSSTKDLDPEESESEDQNDMTRFKEVDGVRLRAWLWTCVQKTGIQKFTNIQKQFLKSFATPGDIHYKGVANGGKTICTVLAVLNSIQPLVTQTQAVIVTSNTRSCKQIQNSLTIDDGKVSILRTDEILQASSNPKKPFKRQCHILVGTCDQIKEIVSKNILNNERISHLIIDNAEEIFGAGLKTVLYKILYALNASVKVTLVSRSSCSAASELEEFCKKKLRYPLELEETVDMGQFLISQPRTKSRDTVGHSISNKVSVTGASSASSTVSECSVKSASEETVQESKVSSSIANDTNVYNPRSPEIADDEAVSQVNDSDSENSNSTCRSFIPKTTLKFLGIDDPGATITAISHLYANIVGDDYKVEIISQLDIEEDKTIIFCRSIERTEWLSTKLRQHKLWPQVLHENVPRKDQKAILENFRQGSFCRVLISTDFLTSISLDSADVVLNFDLPATSVVYRNRSAFADREMMNPKSKGYNKEVNAVVITLISEKEHEILMEFGESLGLVIESAYKSDQDKMDE
ncbi:unnamed protein product [Orchesella dallaii]|uniref:ATP-dependent RNA helicase n=1 Tax=Orchesella dallaii TaxID=48710 RepID=A0ABP1Q999_9HEXA